MTSWTGTWASASLCLAFVMASVAVGQGQGDPRVGTWKLNPAKSKTSGAPPRSGSIKYEAAAGGSTMIADSVDSAGAAYHYELTGALDGKDVKIVGRCPWGDTAARTRIDDKTNETVYKQNGKVTVTIRSVLSGDGRSITFTSTGSLPDGTKVGSVAVYDKQ